MSARKYFDGKHWRLSKTKLFTKAPDRFRCIECGSLVRNASKKFCAKHIDWTKTAHSQSLLTNKDVEFIAENVNYLSDHEIVQKLLCKKIHVTHSKSSVLLAVRHHRRKYLHNRYDPASYRTVRELYKKSIAACEICGWNEAHVDVHHILQEKDFSEKYKYHEEKNLICLCPNHHRIVEVMRSKNCTKYLSFISQFKINRL